MSFNNIPVQQTQANDNSQKYHYSQAQSDSSDRSYAMCFSLYLIQGAVISIGQTMPYLYKQLPSYQTLAYFSFIEFPFSLKFLITPFMEKYTNMQYGKRKTWIVFSQIICSIVLFFSSFFTDVTLATLFALILMLSVFFLAIQDISLDSLSIKEIKSTQRSSMLQSIAQPLGTVVGSLFLLKLTSIQFASKVGISDAITTPQILIRVVSFALMITAVMMHFSFKETFLECQKRGNQKGFWEIITYAKIFMNIESKYSRTIIFILIYNQGLKFYQSGYEYELIKAGFSRDNLNSISNLIVIPVIALTVFINRYINRIGLKNLLVSVLLFQCLIYMFNVYIFSLNPKVVIFTQFLAQLCISFKSMMLYIMINGFPIHALTGMFITIMLSFWNVSQIKTFNTLLIDVMGWRMCALIGIVIQLFIIYKIYFAIFQWINEGTIEIDAEIANDNKHYSTETLTFTSNSDNFQPEEVQLSKQIFT